MRKISPFTWLCSFFLLTGFISLPYQKHLAYNSSTTSPLSNEVIGAINDVRKSNGLQPYQINPILMAIAQEQAEYMASIGTWTHTGPNGSRPYQRALETGYLIAGDLSSGGLFNENVRMENNLLPPEVVQVWVNDADDANAIISPTFEDVGVGVAIIDRTYYYCLDVGLSTHGTPVSYTPPGPTLTATIVQSTPNPDGSVVHIVVAGDTLLSISLAYDVPLGDILRLNGLTLNSVIYPNGKLTIRSAFTPTPTVPSPTPSRIPTSTPWPSSTPRPSPQITNIPISTQIPDAKNSDNNAMVIFAGIVILAIIIGIIFSVVGKRK
jgi:uncharacterized protein YkwD/LysM repeat protein